MRSLEPCQEGSGRDTSNGNTHCNTMSIYTYGDEALVTLVGGGGAE